MIEKHCTNPLVKSLGDSVRVDFVYSDTYEQLSVCKGARVCSYTKRITGLNDEQALWEPRLKWWQKIFNKVVA